MTAKIITLAQQKGGVGKTTISVHLSVAFHRIYNKILLIDIDPQSSLSTWYKIRKSKFNSSHQKLEFLSIPGWRLANEIKQKKYDYDLIIIDSPPQLETESKNAIRVSNLVIIPIQASPTDLWATDAILDMVNKEKKQAYILLNRVATNTKIFNQISTNLTNLLNTTISNRTIFASSMLEGKTAMEIAPSSLATNEIYKLTEEIDTILNSTMVLTE